MDATDRSALTDTRTVAEKRRGVPGPAGRPIIGSYFDVQRDPLGFLIRANRAYGHIFRFRVAWQDWYHISHPEYLEQVLQRQYTNYPKGPFSKLLSLAIGNGIVTAEGDAWARERRLMRPAFHHDRLAGFASTTTQEVARLLDAWDRLPDPRRVELFAELARLTLAIVGRTLFSVDISDEAAVFGHAFARTLGYLNYRLVHPFALPLQVPTPRNRRYREAVRTMNAVLMPIIEARRRSTNAAGDLLSMLLAARDEQGEPMSDVQLCEELKTLLTAGHETTAATLFWCFDLLARHPEHERRLHDEVDQLTGPPSLADLTRLPFTRMVVDEALRLYPSIVWLGRVAVVDDEIGGFPIPAGARVLFSLYITHRHPDFWERPDMFDPDRFDSAHASSRPRGAFLPFGMGPRQCIGINFALMEAQLVLAAISRRYRVRLESDEPPQPELLATLRPRQGVTMRLEPRHRNP